MHAARLAFTNHAPTQFSHTTRTRHDIARCRDEPPNQRTRLASVQNALAAQAVAVQALDGDWAHQTATKVVKLCGAVVPRLKTERPRRLPYFCQFDGQNYGLT